ncbi:ATP-grasp domain-containing protein [Spirosoma sp. SC4-14]|uniref:ATP-grasp domain-containing protein n=1 Tax=Spirosoma sp. SC4-14 TaxID=3128900 RepID=UPI0030CE51BF
MNDTINILFLGGAKRVSVAEAFIGAGQKLGKTVQIFSYELSEQVPIAFVGQIIVGLRWNDPAILTHLNDTIATHHIQIVIPFLDPATLIASQLDQVTSNVFIPISSEEACSIFFNKIKANDWFTQQQFPIPVATATLPLIAKPAFGSASKGIMILNTAQEKAYFEQTFPTNEYLVQRFVDGVEYSVDCYVSPRTGDILCIVPRKRLEVTAGEVTQTITQKNTQLIALCRDMLQKSGLRGPITIQFLEEKATGDFYFMEVNPRFGGGVMAAVGAGANIPLYILQDYLGIPQEPAANWTDNLLMIRTYREFYKTCN